MLNKILGGVIVALLLVCGGLVWHCHDLKTDNNDLHAKVLARDVEIVQLTGQVKAKAAQQDFKSTELAQTSELLDLCYKALAGQNKDFKEIEDILQLPSKERTDACSPDQDAACLDFLNRQLSDIR